MRIVVVDDDPMMRQALKAVLAACGFEPLLYDSCEAAFISDDLAGAGCVVSDVVLPGMSGFDFWARLTSAGSRLPIIFITAHDEPAVHEAASRAGASALFIKPFSCRALASAVDHAMRAEPRAAP